MDYSVYNVDSYYYVNGLQDSTKIKFIHYWTRDEFGRGDATAVMSLAGLLVKKVRLISRTTTLAMFLLKVLHYKSI